MPPALPQTANPIISIPHTLNLRSLLASIADHTPRSPPRTIPSPTRSAYPVNLASLFRRQTTTVTASPSSNPIIPAFYTGIAGAPDPGTVVGIVFGSVAGFLLLLWLIYTCFNFGTNFGRSSVVDEETVRRRSRSRSTARRRSISSHDRSEVIEISRRTERSRSRTKSPPRRESRRETVIIEETRRPAPRPPSEVDEVVEVFEEHSPVRRESRRTKVSGGFRTVDPEAFGGGDRPMRKVSRRDR